MRLLAFFLFASVAIAGCIVEEEECTVSGTWTVTTVLGAGDCGAVGTRDVENLTITRIGETFRVMWAGGLQGMSVLHDDSACTMSWTESRVIPETAETYELRVNSTVTIHVDDNMDGQFSIDGSTYEAGVLVGNCTQGGNLTGNRR